MSASDYPLPTSDSVDHTRRERFAHMLRRRLKPANVAVELQQWGDDALVLLLHELEAYRSAGRRKWVLGMLGQVRDLLIDALDHANPGIRYHAALTLGALQAAPALPSIIAYLHDPHIGVRRRALAALADLGDPRAAASVIAMLQDTDARVRLDAITALEYVGDTTTVTPLIPSLTDPAFHDEAARVIGALGGPQAHASLTAMLTHKTDTIRAAAARGLGKLGDRAAVPALRACLHDHNPTVCAEAAHALGDIGDPQAVPDLIAVLNDTATYVVASEYEYPVNMDAAYALGCLGDQRAVEPLLIALEQLAGNDERETHYPCFMETVCAIVVALGRLADSRVLPRLNRMLARIPEGESHIYGSLSDEVVPDVQEKIRQRRAVAEDG